MKTSFEDHAFVDLATASEILAGGGICAFATETVYGLGADATNANAVLRIYATKGRPRFNPLIVHCADRDMAERLVQFNEDATRLADALWPGPLTLVLPMKAGNGIVDIVTAGLDTLAVRVPAHRLARALIAAVGRPIAAPSANPSGQLSPTRAAEVVKDFDGKVPVLDGGDCAKGLESTIIACRDDIVVQLRAGAVAHDVIEKVLGRSVARATANAAITAPGMLVRHYAPATALRLDVIEPRPDEAFLAFGNAPASTGPRRNLSPAADLGEAARNLFSMLHELDAAGATSIAVAPIPETGLGEAINDRLRRAATRD
jgi:L-threonylcarbamoyladenylate synthase